MTITPDKELVLAKLAEGKIHSLSPAIGKVLAEACAMCLNEQKHKKGVELRVEFKEATSSSHVFRIQEWEEVTEKLKRSYNDLQDATEEAACGIAFLLIFELTDYKVVERSRKSTGFDYWLSKKEFEDDLLFSSRDARLEISGILEETKTNSVEKRIRQKLRQSNPTDYTLLPAYAVVVEFSKPRSHVVRK